MNQSLRRWLLGGLAILLLVAFLAPELLAQDTPPDVPAAQGPQKISLTALKEGSSELGTTTGQRLQSLLGMAFLIGVCFLLSNNRRKVSWRLVAWGLGLQLLLGVFVMKTDLGKWVFGGLNDFVASLLNYTTEGSSFLFGNLSKMNNMPVGSGFIFGPVSSEGQVAEVGAFFAFNVLPTIIFFSSLMAVLYHLGAMQWVVKGVAWVMQRTMGTSGSETVSAAGNIFVGQTEAPLLVRPFVDGMTMSELMAVMTGGFATVAGGVLAAYVGMLNEHFSDIAGHLISASVMSAPAALVCAKLMVPEPVPEKSQTYGELKVELEKIDVNVIDAAARGAGDGLKLALNVGAMLLAFIALIAMFNGGLGWACNRVADLTYGDAWSERVEDAQTALKELRARQSADPQSVQPGDVEEVELLFAALAGEVLGSTETVKAELDGAGAGFVEEAGYWRVSPDAFDPGVVGVTGVESKVPTVSPYRGGIATAEEGGWEGAWRTATLQGILGLLLAPLAWLMGVPWGDAQVVGQLIGIKTILNEFVAYGDLAGILSSGQLQHPRSVVIVCYALCGFANFGSIAIQIGGIGGIAPGRRHDLAKIGLKAMIAGTIAALLTATVAGILV